MAAKPNLAELIEKLPPTDKEIEAQKAAERAQADPAKPLAKPAKDAGASKFTGPDPDVADRLCEEVLAGGRENLIALINLVRDPAAPEFKSYKPEYLLHCLALYVGRPGKETQRTLFAEALVSQLGNTQQSAVVRAFLLRELQWIGGDGVVKALGRFLTDELMCEHAAAALVAIKNGAAEELRAALSKAQGKCRLVVVQSLGAVRDGQAVNALQQALGDGERDVRLAAAWGLARLGDAASVERLIKAADVEPGYERIKATQACLVLAENLVAAGKKKEAAKIYTFLRATRTDPKEAYVREAATLALDGLGGQLL